jgi:hypothetical protein
MSERDRIIRKMTQIERVFEREPGSWRRHLIGEDVADIAVAIVYNDISVRRVCIAKPASPIPLKKIEQTTGSRESTEHALAKWLLADHMRRNGSPEPIFEYARDGFRHDVYCDAQDWAGECGHTTVSWLANRINGEQSARLTLIPFQRGLRNMVRDFHYNRPIQWLNVWGVEFKNPGKTAC